jgi:hypothetical protein
MVSCTCGLLPNLAKSQISNMRHDGNLSIGNFMLMMKKPNNLEFEPVPQKMCSLLPWVHGISCLFFMDFPHDSKIQKENPLSISNYKRFPSKTGYNKKTARHSR